MGNKEIVDFIPVAWREPASGSANGKLAIWLNGFTGSKDAAHIIDFLEKSANIGFVAVSFDLYQHGERLMETQEEMVRRVNGNRRKYFWEILGRTAEEFPRIIDWAEARFGPFSAVYAGGISMGGDIALTASGIDARIEGACCMIATPEWTRPGAAEPQGEPDSYSAGLYDRWNPASQLARYAERRPAIHFENAGADRFVPPDAARSFINALRPLFGEDANKLTLHETPDVDHGVAEGMHERCLAWFAEHGE